MPNWIIKSSISDSWWSNSLGWMDRNSATEYTDEEKSTIVLPVGGRWLELKPAEKPVCSTCGSDDVRTDAYAVWDVKMQEWVLETAFEKPAVCEKCGGECSLEWVAIDG